MVTRTDLDNVMSCVTTVSEYIVLKAIDNEYVTAADIVELERDRLSPEIVKMFEAFNKGTENGVNMAKLFREFNDLIMLAFNHLLEKGITVYHTEKTVKYRIKREFTNVFDIEENRDIKTPYISVQEYELTSMKPIDGSPMDVWMNGPTTYFPECETNFAFQYAGSRADGAPLKMSSTWEKRSIETVQETDRTVSMLRLHSLVA